MIENTYAAINIGTGRGRLTKQQCIDLVYYNILKGKFFNQKKLIKNSCMREKNSLSFHWGYSQGKDPFMTIKCSLWNKWLKKSRPEYIQNFDYK